MTLSVTPTGAACGAIVTGVKLSDDLSTDLVAELRAH